MTDISTILEVLGVEGVYKTDYFDTRGTYDTTYWTLPSGITGYVFVLDVRYGKERDIYGQLLFNPHSSGLYVRFFNNSTTPSSWYNITKTAV